MKPSQVRTIVKVLLEHFSDCEVGVDNDGQFIIYTGIIAGDEDHDADGEEVSE